MLLLEETGRAALPEAVVETAAVAAPLLAALENRALADPWLARDRGRRRGRHGRRARRTRGSPRATSPTCCCSRATPRSTRCRRAERPVRQRVPHLDGAQRLFRVDVDADGAHARRDRRRGARAARGRASTAARSRAPRSSLGVGRAAASTRPYGTRSNASSSGTPIGSFQAIKHMLATAQVRLEFARPVVYRAAFAVARDLASARRDVSHAKVVAAEAAALAARTALQVHGAIGYTWEVDLHVWMKRAWALETVWGTSGWHRARVAAAVLDGDARD